MEVNRLNVNEKKLLEYIIAESIFSPTIEGLNEYAEEKIREYFKENHPDAQEEEIWSWVQRCDWNLRWSLTEGRDIEERIAEYIQADKETRMELLDKDSELWYTVNLIAKYKDQL